MTLVGFEGNTIYRLCDPYKALFRRTKDIAFDELPTLKRAATGDWESPGLSRPGHCQGEKRAAQGKKQDSQPGLPLAKGKRRQPKKICQLSRDLQSKQRGYNRRSYNFTVESQEQHLMLTALSHYSQTQKSLKPIKRQPEALTGARGTMPADLRLILPQYEHLSPC